MRRMTTYLTALASLGALLAAPALAAEPNVPTVPMLPPPMMTMHQVDYGIVSLKNPEAFFQTLAEMGYDPRDFKYNPTLPTMLITVDGQPTSVTLGGCIERKNCTYIYLSAEYSDIVNPPSDWLERMNVEFDIIKVSRNERLELTISESHVIEGIPRSTLRLLFDLWAADGNAIADEAQALLSK